MKRLFKGSHFLFICALFILLQGCCNSLTKADAAHRLAELDSMRNIQSHENKIAPLHVLDQIIRMNYIRSGNKNSKTKLVLIHGYPDSLLTWDNNIEALKDYDVYAMDLPGQGLTQAEKLSIKLLRPKAQGECVSGFIDKVVLNSELKNDPEFKLILIGHSFGGLVACAVADSRKDVDGLVLIDSEGVPREDSQYLESEKELRECWKGFFSACFGGADLLYSEQGWRDKVKKAYLEMSEKSKVKPTELQILEYSTLIRVPSNYYTNRNLVRRDLKDDAVNLEKIGRMMGDRTLIVWGVYDVLFPFVGKGQMSSHKDSFVTWFSGCEFKKVIGAGHSPHRENFIEFNQILTNFIKDLINENNN